MFAMDIVKKYQRAFKKRKSTTDHIHTLRQLIVKHYEYNKNFHMLFIDFKQAYIASIGNTCGKL